MAVLSEGVENRCERRGGQSASCLSMYEISRVYTDTELDLTKGSARGVQLFTRSAQFYHTNRRRSPRHTSFYRISHRCYTHTYSVYTPFTFSPTISPTSGSGGVWWRARSLSRHLFCERLVPWWQRWQRRRGITPNPRRQQTTSGPIV